LEEFQTTIHLRGCMGWIYSSRDIWALRAIFIVQYRELEQACSWFHYHTHQRFCYVHFTCENDGKFLFLLHPFFYLLFFKIYLTNNIFFLASYGSWMRAKLDETFCGNARVDHKKRCSNSSIVEFSTLWYVSFQFVFCKLFFFEFADFFF